MKRCVALIASSLLLIASPVFASPTMESVLGQVQALERAGKVNDVAMLMVKTEETAHLVSKDKELLSRYAKALETYAPHLAARRYREVLALDPTDMPSILGCGLTLLQTMPSKPGDAAEALALLGKASEAYASNTQALAKITAALGDGSGILLEHPELEGKVDALLARLAVLDPKNGQAAVNRVKLAELGGDPEAVRARLERIVAASPDSAPALVALGKSLLSDGPGNSRGWALLKKAFALAPGDDEVATEVLAHFVAGNRWSEVETLSRQWVATKPDEIKAYRSLTLAILKQNRPAEAEVPMRAFMQRQPQHSAEACTVLAVLLDGQGQWPQAEKMFQQAQTYKPANSLAWLHYARALQRHQRAKDALTQYQKAIAVDPKNTAASCEYAKALVAAHRKADAKKLLQKAHALLPDDSDIADALAALK